ncbi:unnamed protein product [Oreochromis niloticus]|nr:unnamed protein product [Mustela putorius furo]
MLLNSWLKKKNSTSLIWRYFGFDKDDVLQTQVLCKTCRTLVATTRGNTTNLHHHLQYNHRELFEDFQKDRASQTKVANVKTKSTAVQQPSLYQSFSSGIPYEKTSKRYKEITEAITHFLAKDMMPINTVSREGFTSLIHKVDQRYRIPSRNYFSHVAIPQMYETCRKTVMFELSQAENYASTTDLWSSRTTEPYMSFTVHFLTEDFELKTRCLETVYFPDSHTSENIAHVLREVLASWDLKEDRQVCITTDNGANVVRATELNNWVRLQCFGHRLHLAIENSIKDDARIARAIGLCKKTFLPQLESKDGSEKSTAEAQPPRAHTDHRMPNQVGFQKMIERVLEQQRAISDVISADKKSRHLIPTWQDLEVLESVNQALHPLQDFTDALSGESYVSVSYVKPVLHLMKTSVLAEKEEDSDLTKSIKKKILEYLITKYENPATQELLDMACFMDPRFKVSYTSTDRVSDIKTRVMSEMEAVAQKVFMHAYI